MEKSSNTSVKNDVAIVVPMYKTCMSCEEQISWEQMCKVFSDRKIIAVLPNSLREKVDLCENIEIKYFDDKYFIGREGYNNLMTNSDFYKGFASYKYILICQLDVFVFEDKLDEFCAWNVDYIGAPWLNGVRAYNSTGYNIVYVGNGGCSLRKVNTFIDFFSRYKMEEFFWEDYYISSYGSVLKIPTIEMALRFAFEGEVKKCFEISNNQLPMAIHGWWRFDFSTLYKYLSCYDYDFSSVIDGKLDFVNKKKKYFVLDCEGLKLREKLFNGLPILCKDIIIWGAGKQGELMGWILRKSHITSFRYVDIDSKRHNGKLHEADIGDPLKCTECDYRNCSWIICVEGHVDEIKKKLTENGVDSRNIISYLEVHNCLGLYE